MSLDRVETEGFPASRREFFTGIRKRLQVAHTIEEAVAMAQSDAEGGINPPRFGRRRFLELVFGAAFGAIVASVDQKLMGAAVAFAQQYGRFKIIYPDNYPSGRGEQSFVWVRASVPINRHLDKIDEAEQVHLGEWAYSAQRGPSGDQYQAGAEAQMKSTPNGSSWVGNCFAAKVASGDLSVIPGDMTEPPAPGLPVMNYEELMVLGVIMNRHVFRELIAAKPWTREKFEKIKEIQAWLLENDIKQHLIADTSERRGFPGQEWYVYVRGFRGDTVLCTDFLEWSEVGNKPWRKDYEAPYHELTAVYLADPRGPQAGAHEEETFLHQINYYYTVYRPMADVYLGRAIIEY